MTFWWSLPPFETKHGCWIFKIWKILYGLQVWWLRSWQRPKSSCIHKRLKDAAKLYHANTENSKRPFKKQWKSLGRNDINSEAKSGSQAMTSRHEFEFSPVLTFMGGLMVAPALDKDEWMFQKLTAAAGHAPVLIPFCLQMSFLRRISTTKCNLLWSYQAKTKHCSECHFIWR